MILDEPVVYSKLLPLCVFIAADLCVIVMVWTRVQGTWREATESYTRVVAAVGDMARRHRIQCEPYHFQARRTGDMATGHRNRDTCSGRGGTWPEATETERVPLGSGGDMARGHSKPPREIPPGKRHEADALGGCGLQDCLATSEASEKA